MKKYLKECCLYSVIFFMLSCSTTSVQKEMMPISKEIYRAEFQFKYIKVKEITIKDNQEIIGEPVDNWLYFKVYFELDNGKPVIAGENLNSVSVGSPYRKFVTEPLCEQAEENHLCIPAINLYVPISNLGSEYHTWDNFDKSYLFSHQETFIGVISGFSSTIHIVDAVPRDKNNEKFKFWLSDKFGLIAFSSEKHSWILAKEEPYGIGALTLNRDQKVVDSINMKKFKKRKFIEKI